MPQLTFYTHPQSRGRITRWMLEEIEQPYQTILLDYRTTMKAPEYLRINPMGKVPAIVHGTSIVTETPAVLTYLAESFPNAGLMSDDRASFYRWMFFAAGPLESAIVNAALGVQVAPEQSGFVGYGSLDRVLDTLDAALTARDWLAGDSFSAVDLYVGSQIGYGLRFNTIPARPSFTAYWDRMKDRPAYQSATDMDDSLMAGQQHG
jgi:glutathione S-transferase